MYNFHFFKLNKHEHVVCISILDSDHFDHCPAVNDNPGTMPAEYSVKPYVSEQGWVLKSGDLVWTAVDKVRAFLLYQSTTFEVMHFSKLSDKESLT